MLCLIADVQTFSLWFLEQVPDFLMSEPICYFVGLALGIVVLNLIHRIISFS